MIVGPIRMKGLHEPLLPQNDERRVDNRDNIDYEYDDDLEDEQEFHDAIMHYSSPPTQPPRVTLQLSSSQLTSSSTSYYGKASQLSTGSLFHSSPQGVVVSIPHPHKPCLLFADHCPISACAHISLLEKEIMEYPEEFHLSAASITPGNNFLSEYDPKLFTVVHVCEYLAKRGDAGMRLLKKIMMNSINNSNKNSTFVGSGSKIINFPILLHEENILLEASPVAPATAVTPTTTSTISNTNSLEGMCATSSFTSTLKGGKLLLPEYIDQAIGTTRNTLTPQDAVGMYNMNLFIQKYSSLPYLFHQLLSSESPMHRITVSTQLLHLLKIIDADLQKFTSGPYLCGTQFTLADIYIFPYIERIVVVLSFYRNFFLPPSLTHLIHWYSTVSKRPSVRMATADRSQVSMDTYCFEQRSRKEYLREVYESHARQDEKVFRELNDERGRAGVNVYREVIEEEMRDRTRVCDSTKSCQKCVVS